ncbi:MAG TPA: hypothetical protein VFY84_19515, partial [Jiangellales bacterium]|nr:hypothetical protein [Jiangellales bacterium]
MVITATIVVVRLRIPGWFRSGPLRAGNGPGFVAAVVAAALVGRLLAGFIAFLATAVLIVYFVLPPAGFAGPDG